MRWLWTGEAIKAHMVFVFLIVLLTSELLAGNQGPAGDYPLGLVFCVVGYPVVVLLLWVRWRIDGGDARTKRAEPSSGSSDMNK